MFRAVTPSDATDKAVQSPLPSLQPPPPPPTTSPPLRRFTRAAGQSLLPGLADYYRKRIRTQCHATNHSMIIWWRIKKIPDGMMFKLVPVVDIIVLPL
jgi:hypothetical protein